MLALKPEFDLLPINPRRPDPADTDYLAVVESSLPKKRFNNIEQQTRRVDISVHTVIFDAVRDTNRLFKRFSNKLDIEELTIEAERVIIRSPVHFPQCNIVIYAKELVFEDIDSSYPANISTEPEPYKTPNYNPAKPDQVSLA